MNSVKHQGASFEVIAKEVISAQKRVALAKDVVIQIGLYHDKKKHKFDLGNIQEKILIECKHHAWTASGKMTIWNEAMLYFILTPKDYTNILFVKKSLHSKKKETLAEYYFRTYSHLIPNNVEIWEYDVEDKELKIYNI